MVILEMQKARSNSKRARVCAGRAPLRHAPHAEAHILPLVVNIGVADGVLAQALQDGVEIVPIAAGAFPERPAEFLVMGHVLAVLDQAVIELQPRPARIHIPAEACREAFYLITLKIRADIHVMRIDDLQRGLLLPAAVADPVDQPAGQTIVLRIGREAIPQPRQAVRGHAALLRLRLTVIPSGSGAPPPTIT